MGTLLNDMVGVAGSQIDADQYNAWRANFGAQAGSSSVTIPEPAAAVDAAWLALFLSAASRPHIGAQDS